MTIYIFIYNIVVVVVVVVFQKKAKKMKTTIAVTLDGELVTEARIKNVKFSEFFNNSLKSLLEIKEEDADENIEDRIINAKARLMSLESEREKEQTKKEKNITFRKEI